MSTRTYTVTFSAPGTAVLPAGRFFYVKQATAALTIRTRGNPGYPITFENVGAGLKFGPVPADKAWVYLDIESGAIQTIEVVVSDEAEVDIASTVTVSGSVTVSQLPASALADTAPVNCANAAQTAIVPANAARRRVGLSFLSSATIGAGTVFIRATGGTQNLVEVQAGVLYTFEGTYGLDIRNDSGGALSCMVVEES